MTVVSCERELLSQGQLLGNAVPSRGLALVCYGAAGDLRIRLPNHR